jgi:hypothetical protein
MLFDVNSKEIYALIGLHWHGNSTTTLYCSRMEAKISSYFRSTPNLLFYLSQLDILHFTIIKALAQRTAMKINALNVENNGERG